MDQTIYAIRPSAKFSKKASDLVLLLNINVESFSLAAAAFDLLHAALDTPLIQIDDCDPRAFVTAAKGCRPPDP